jgi:hypothetical protein
VCSDGSDETGFEFGAGLSAGRGRRGISKTMIVFFADKFVNKWRHHTNGIQQCW